MCFEPAEMAVPPLNELTVTGILLDVNVPIPSSPSRLKPQHLNTPELFKAQDCPPPLEILIIPEVSPLTFTGVFEVVLLALPSWPKLLYPQHLTAPAVVKAHVC